MFVCVREKEIEKESESERETDRQRNRERENVSWYMYRAWGAILRIILSFDCEFWCLTQGVSLAQ